MSTLMKPRPPVHVLKDHCTLKPENSKEGTGVGEGLPQKTGMEAVSDRTRRVPARR